MAADVETSAPQQRRRSVSERSLSAAVFSGSCGGFAATVVGHPFESVKVRLQTDRCRLASGQPSIFRNLYAGLLSPLVSVPPLWALAFWSYRLGFELLPDVEHLPSDSSLRDPIFRSAIAGSFCGLVQTVVSAPSSVVKVVAQNEHSTSQAALRQLWARAGVRGVYRGLVPTAMFAVPSQFIYFGGVDLFRARLPSGPGSMLEEGSVARSFVAGGLAGVCEWTVCMPLDTVKTRFQAGRYARTRDVFFELWAQSGIRGFYRGMLPVLLRAFPANGAAWIAVDAANSFIDMGLGSNAEHLGGNRTGRTD
jgi:solute carrier family 25 carnitine/acylcarnitine transporter 20/29